MSVFGKVAQTVDQFFQRKYYVAGSCVSSRPCTSIALTMLFCLVCMGGFSQMKSESRADKLWIPQGTDAQKDEAQYTKHFPPMVRRAGVLLEAKSGNSAVTKDFLVAAMELHDKIELVKTGNDTLRTLCMPMSSMGHPCFITSVLSAWNYDITTLRNDANPLATLNSDPTLTKRDLERMLGSPKFDGVNLLSAKSLRITYFLQSNRVDKGGDYEDPRGEEWEEKYLELLKCDAPTCSDDNVCACGYSSSQFNL